MSEDRRFYEGEAVGGRRSAPAALRNRQPIGDVLEEWLPKSGLVLEIASGTGEHAAYFAERFPNLDWQPSDVHANALSSIRAWRVEAGMPNLLESLVLDAESPGWPVDAADAVLSINMVHISPWTASLGLIRGSARVLAAGGPLMLYGPWVTDSAPTAASNLAFDSDLRQRDERWGLRKVEDFASSAGKWFALEEIRPMPANNMMLLFRRNSAKL